jgi:DNA topoisomerase-1
MPENLVIVESPAKARTISKFLGKEYEVTASMGHVRDLPESKMGIDVEKNFKPTYEISTDKKKLIKDIKSKIKEDTTIWIATDEDREGEAIGWHLLEALKVNPDKNPVKRIVFHEITKGAIVDSIKNPREINQDLVDAQQARRILDRLVGYELSPLLWKKIRFGLSAGRVQSVAVRLIVDREREIMAFNPEEYWTISGIFQNANRESFETILKKISGKEAKIGNESQANEVLAAIKNRDFIVSDLKEKQVKRSPAPPFTTSTLQQEAARKLGFSVKQTMTIAQRLYEGINMGKETQGLITYMRTDSVNLSQTALADAKKVISEKFGKEFTLDSPRYYKSKKGAQEAHEAIRPVNLQISPDDAAKYLDKDQLRLYELIWKRTLASQMQEAVFNTISADIEPSDGKADFTFRATGQSMVFAGFMRSYVEGSDSPEEELESREKLLPLLKKQEALHTEKFDSKQHFTKPPARFTEASLVKHLESEGIGRPSTYAPTISTIISRGYIEKENKQLRPTDLAMIVTDLLTKHFSDIVDHKFTAHMEESLDAIAEGKQKWVPVLKNFYLPFHENIKIKEEQITKDDALKERILGVDEKTGLEVVVRHGRFGAFVQLGNYSKEEIKEMTKKPRRASLPKNLFFETVNFEQAMKILSLPRDLGEAKSGEKVEVNVGRFGPYVKVGDKNVSLPKDIDPHEVELEQALEIFETYQKNKAEQQKPLKDFGVDAKSGSQILAKKGPFGFYITDGKTNASISRKIIPLETSFEDAEEIVEQNFTMEKALEMLENKRKNPSKKRGWGRKK